jgi:hypothetical protein
MEESKWLEIAEKAFNAYNKQAGGKTWDGKDIPPFAEVGDKVRANWIAAVKEVAVTPNSFSWALDRLKEGKKVTRSGWVDKGIWVELQRPTETSKMTKPYLFMVKGDDIFPLDLSCESVMAEDWVIKE